MNIDRAVIEINGGCNYSCQMCPQSRPEGRGKNWLKKMDLKKFESVVEELSAKGLNVVNLEGGGEATLNPNLPDYIKIVKKYGAKAYLFSNGYRMQGRFMNRVVDAGIDFYRFSIIGYNKEKYKEWMNSEHFDVVVDNLHEMQKYVERSGSSCIVSTYHLITDNDNINYELEKYLEIVNSANVNTEIWKIHNWAGNYTPPEDRKGTVKTCGRPFSPDIVIRAGGEENKWGAVHPCCQVLGNDDAAILGHMSDNTAEEIWYGDKYEELRNQHRTGNYPDYCKSCDFLIDDPEVLVYSNHTRLHKMHGTRFDLNDFRY